LAIGENSKAYLAIVVAMVSVSWASIFIKWSESPPFIIAAYRLSFTCLLLLPFMVMSGGFRGIRRFDARDLILILTSGVALAFHFGLWIVSLTLTLVPTSAILVTSHPLFVAAVSHFLLNEKVKRVAAFGILIAFSGVIVIALSDLGEGTDSLIGDLLAFVGGICAGIYFLSGRVARQKISLGPYVFSVYGLSAVFLFVGASVAGDSIIVTSMHEILLFLVMALVPSILGHTMLNYALKTVPAHVISTSVLAEPVGASILVFFLLPHEVPGAWIFLGGGLVILGLYVVLTRGFENPRGGGERASGSRNSSERALDKEDDDDPQ